MKLLFCPICHDVLGLLGEEWRTCVCGCAGGQYNDDNMTATVGGAAKVIGIGNPFFNPLWIHLTPEKKRELRQQYYGQPDSDAWYGEYPGDIQIFRITSPNGPRLKVTVEPVQGSLQRTLNRWEPGENKVTVVDERPFTIDGKDDLLTVVVPANISPAIRQLIDRKAEKDELQHGSRLLRLLKRICMD